LDDVAKVYLGLRERQRDLVFNTETAYEAEQRRKRALAYATTELHRILKERGDPRAEK